MVKGDERPQSTTHDCNPHQRGYSKEGKGLAATHSIMQSGDDRHQTHHTRPLATQDTTTTIRLQAPRKVKGEETGGLWENLKLLLRDVTLCSQGSWLKTKEREMDGQYIARVLSDDVEDEVQTGPVTPKSADDDVWTNHGDKTHEVSKSRNGGTT